MYVYAVYYEKKKKIVLQSFSPIIENFEMVLDAEIISSAFMAIPLKIGFAEFSSVDVVIKCF